MTLCVTPDILEYLRGQDPMAGFKLSETLSIRERVKQGKVGGATHWEMGRRQLDEVVAFARSRRQFGQAIGTFQSVANRVVDMKVRLEAARPLVHRIGRLKDDGRNAMMEAAADAIVLRGSTKYAPVSTFIFLTEILSPPFRHD